MMNGHPLVQALDQHWSKQARQANALATAGQHTQGADLRKLLGKTHDELPSPTRRAT
jgi:hypothetical protein